MRRQRTYILVLSLLGFLLYAAGGRAAEAAVLDISPAALEIGLFFSGCEVHVSGSVAAGRDVVIEIIGPAEKGKFKIKEKIGPFWMSRRQVEIRQAPFFYALLLPQSSRLDGNIPGIGIESLKKNISVSSEEMPGDKVFDLFVRLKRAEKLYKGPVDDIRYLDAADGKKGFSVKFDFPSSIAEGDYKVMATIVHDGRVEGQLVRSIRIQEGGIVKAIHGLAYQHSLVYGILAVVIALLVGMLMGVVFKGGKSH